MSYRPLWSGIPFKEKQKGVNDVVEFKHKELGKREMNATVVEAEVAVGKKFKTVQLHFEFAPIGLDWENQHEWYMLSDDEDSAFGKLVERLVSLKVITDAIVSGAKDLDTLANQVIEAVSGKVFFWKEEPTPKKQKNIWLPVSVKSEQAAETKKK